ncbi:PREDICTED: CD180 antigen [Gekko japonicus]|uniref:CD180 antigen n=1 Tax=Gekko japonicus TaxID=146911 RepID=A0ABM1L3N3_GEKJA|nr:PREDICTED: CD180 antigen [Gekko japonicus]
MACGTYCWLLMGLLGISCEVTKAVDKMCIEITANRSYSCEDLGLRQIPEYLPSTTEVLDFSFNFLYTLQPSTFSMLEELVSLDLTRCQINWIYGGAFQSNSHLETIVLTGNLLLFLADEAFIGPSCLKHLDLTQTGIISLAFIPMQDLGNLETLILGSNHIPSLELPSDFPTRNLKYLDFQMNIIQQISAKDISVLKKTSNLTLILKGNNIIHIEGRAFSSMFFYSLNFGGCANVSVILEGLQGTKTVFLWLGTFDDWDNGIDISDSMLQGICDISADDLNLQYHHFSQISAGTFQCLTKLQNIDLTRTSLHMLPHDIVGMNMLKELNLNMNAFTDLCDIHSAAFLNLTHLSIRDNSKKLNLGSGCLETLSKLQHLDLSNSNIESSDCCTQELRGLSSLQHLNLSYNHHLFLHDIAFEDCANLVILDLTFTRIITNTLQGPFRNLHLLQSLNLSHCQIAPSIQHILQGLESLIVLNLHGNYFESGTMLNDNVFGQTPNLEVLILSSCKLPAIQTKAFYALRKLKHVDLSYNNLIAFSSDAFSSLKSIYLNFANNKIRIIPRDMLTSLSGKSVINLSYNPLECTCSNIGLLTWYKQNTDKIEDSEKTVCSEPKSLVGVKLSSVNLSCGHHTAQIILITLVVIAVIAAPLILVTRILKRKYQQI